MVNIDQGVDVSKEKLGYEYYDYNTYREQLLSEENNWAEEPDVCYDTAFSILFFVAITLIGFSFGIYSIVLYFKRRNTLYYGFDILYTLLFASAFIKFCPTIWHQLSIHDSIAPGTSQAGCKLMSYTIIGMSHVVTTLVFCLILYSWVGAGLCSSLPVFKKMSKMTFGDLDSGLRRHLGWFLLFIFALEGVFGMIPAIYMDVTSDGKSCNATQSPDFTAKAFVGAHVSLQVIFPYLVPFALFVYPLISLGKNLHVIEDEIYKSNAKTAIIVASSYALTYTPLAIMQLGIYPAFVGGATLHWGSICVIEGIFTFFQDIWFLYIPFVVMLRDPELGKNFPGKEIVTKFFVEKLCFADIINWNRGSSGGNSRHHDLQEENC